MPNELTVIREGRLLVKANKTDREFQDILVREWSDSDLEYLHPQLFKWFSFCERWSRDQIKWQ